MSERVDKRTNECRSEQKSLLSWWRVASLLVAGVVVTVCVAWSGILFCKTSELNLFALSGGAHTSRESMLVLQSTAYNRRIPRLEYGIVRELWIAKPTESSSGGKHVKDFLVYESGWPCKSMQTSLGYVQKKNNDIWNIRISGWDWWAWYYAKQLREDPFYWYTNEEKHVTRVPLPLTPIWPGFAMCSVFWAGVIGVVWYVPGMVRGAVRRRRGLCAKCAYELRGLDACPECGSLARMPSSAAAAKGVAA